MSSTRRRRVRITSPTYFDPPRAFDMLRNKFRAPSDHRQRERELVPFAVGSDERQVAAVGAGEC
jgi:hypothetical protein